MFKRFLRFLWALVSSWSTITGAGIVSVAALTAVVARMWAEATPWIKALGPYGIFLFTCIAVGFVLLLGLLAVHLRNSFISSQVMNKWKERVDTFNPLDIEFVKKRIKIADLANPSTGVVANKVLVDCDIMGPAVIYFWRGNNINGFYKFWKCDIVVRNPVRDILHAIVFDNVVATNCRFYDCTIIIDPLFFHEHFKNAWDVNIVSFTGDQDFDSPPPLTLEENTQQ